MTSAAPRHPRRPVHARRAVVITIAVLAALLSPSQLAHASTPAAATFAAPAASASALLPDGRYLIAGGCAPGHCPSVLTAAEIYDPTTGQAVPTGSTITPHGYATLTVLASGKALLAGGCSGRLCGQLNPDAEVWNPTTGTWTATGSMLGDPQNGITPEHASAVALASGEVLVAGGVNYSAVAQIWNPTTGSWRATGSMKSPREQFTLTTLQSGLVLAAGGCAFYYCQTVLGSAELYHPATGTWTATGKMIQARYNHTAALLTTGQVRVSNGITAAGTAATITELYNPSTGTWAKK